MVLSRPDTKLFMKPRSLSMTSILYYMHSELSSFTGQHRFVKMSSIQRGLHSFHKLRKPLTYLVCHWLPHADCTGSKCPADVLQNQETYSMVSVLPEKARPIAALEPLTRPAARQIIHSSHFDSRKSVHSPQRTLNPTWRTQALSPAGQRLRYKMPPSNGRGELLYNEKKELERLEEMRAQLKDRMVKLELWDVGEESDSRLEALVEQIASMPLNLLYHPKVMRDLNERTMRIPATAQNRQKQSVSFTNGLSVVAHLQTERNYLPLDRARTSDAKTADSTGRSKPPIQIGNNEDQTQCRRIKHSRSQGTDTIYVEASAQGGRKLYYVGRRMSYRSRSGS
ncbi:uncharacterized protein MYCFIDRAFT_177017 [Pseudocercospora fijiensis CIRAD86]|uniref:Uncharacterized protein n=1 Tax=Pseudocercospora fijiensis (strain CIRAD86) TaxID=383855 RepID=M3ARG3_PSEFD|nr:uncharacterized protein MYCFIDRAFT_177017 [Pseudocercospora fijiensis CIRAD86]EME80027.1 hypothetical protein MYCFIDRAFT_177017 [Pseudocercospora fijiensis CIRAD86]